MTSEAVEDLELSDLPKKPSAAAAFNGLPQGYFIRPDWTVIQADDVLHHVQVKRPMPSHYQVTSEELSDHVFFRHKPEDSSPEVPSTPRASNAANRNEAESSTSAHASTVLKPTHLVPPPKLALI